MSLAFFICAQGRAYGQDGPTPPYGVAVTPDGQTTPQRTSGTGGYAETFWVQNFGSESDTYTISCSGSANVTCTGTSVANLPLAGGQTVTVSAYYNVGAAGTGTLTLTAVSPTSDVSDAGYYNVPVVGVPGPPVVALRNHNGDNRDRSLCLTSGAGEAAAWQCGDLTVTHGLPGYATLGRERSLTLLYSSAQAVPRPAVAAFVNETGISAPQSVFVRLSLNGIPRDSATYNAWTTGALARQIVITHAGTADSSGIYPITLMVRNQYAGATYETSVSDTLLIVNRATSRYGTGWSLVGVEELRLAQPGNKILWIGGDGSAKVYRSAGTNKWASAAAAYRDTLVYDPGTTTYTRTLRHGIKVKFNASGRHLQTVNRVGQTTTFTWSTNNDTLKSITVPPGGTGTTYTLAYASGKLDKITDPAGRILDATVTSSRLAQLVDPDGSAQHTDFAYDAVGRMLGRTSRRGFTTRYAYGNSLRVTIDSVRLDTAVTTYAITSFAPWDEKGLALTQTGNVAVDTTTVFTKIDGPRTTVGDTAEFWVDRWGAPAKTRDPLGFVTLLTRGSSANPALVTRLQDAAGRVLLAYYNSRANPDSVKDSTYQGTGTMQPVVTKYVYGDAAFPDSPTQVKSPVDTLSVSYDSLGLPSLYTAQGGHRTRFVYFPSGVRKGLLSAVTDSLVPVVDTSLWTESNFDLTTQFNYDSLGNIVWMSSPKGLQTTYVRDAYARVHFATDPNHHRTDYYYSLLNAVDTVVVYDDTLLNGAKITRYHYTRSGGVDSVIDVSRTVRRSWRYDAADRPLSMKDDLGNADSNYFSAAGLLDSTRTRDGHVIRHTYNAAGQLTQTIYPASTVMPNSSVPGDTILRTYDAVGRILTATNRNGIDSLQYNLEGSVRSERQVVRADNKATVLDATLRYWYDVGGRPTKFYNGTDTLRYTYGADGNLAKLRVDWMVGALAADSFLFTWDAVGRRDRVQYTNGVDVTFGYDKDGHLRLVCSKHPGGLSGVLDYLERRVRYERLDADGQVIDMHHYQGAADGASCASTDGNPPEFYTSATYDGRHQLLTRSASAGNERYHYDASGNHTADTVGVSTSTFIIAASSNRLSSAVVQGTAYTYTHDPSGNRIKDTTAMALNGTRKYFYNAIGQMVGDSSYWDNGTGFQWWGSLNVFRYDAGGRRVKVANSPSFYVAYDGPNVVQATGGASWRYVHGPGVDDPLVGVSNISGTYTKYYYLTDGGGRQLAFTDGSGANNENQLVYTQNGGSHAGGITSSNGFANGRSGTQEAPKLSFYRNRYYDQQTGRWTQEDPIGIAGGVNLYQYAGNNPAMFTDPFGLKPCPERLAKLQGRLERLARRVRQYRDAHARGLADQDHLDQIQGERDGLNRDLDAYHRDGCDDDDDRFRRVRNQASSFEHAQLPQPQMRYGPRRSEMVSCGDNCFKTPTIALPGFGFAPGLMPFMPGFGLPTFAPLPGLVPVLVP